MLVEYAYLCLSILSEGCDGDGDGDGDGERGEIREHRALGRIRHLLRDNPEARARDLRNAGILQRANPVKDLADDAFHSFQSDLRAYSSA